MARRRTSKATHLMITVIRVLILLALEMILPHDALAQTPNRFEAFVYTTSYYDGATYTSALIPPQAETIYLLANCQNVISPRLTMLYFWPITNRYLADWSMKNQLVEGALEVYQGDKLLISTELVDYVIQYDETDPSGTVQLYTGEDALLANQRFQELQRKYREDLYDYYEAYRQYREKVDELVRQATLTGKTIPEEEFPQPPAEVPPLSIYSQEITKGFVINLPEGNYEIQLRLTDGNIQPESKKKLVVYSKLEDGISYNVVPQERWTKPEKSSYGHSIIYTPEETVLYLQPYYQGLFNDYLYARMVDPQDQSARKDRKRWVAFGPVEDSHLQVLKADGSIEEVELGSYFVQQLSGSGLGYKVVEFDPNKMERPTFNGFKISLGSGSVDYRIRLLDGNGRYISGSERQIRVLYTDRAPFLYLLSCLPLLVGLGVLLERRRRTLKIKVDE